MSIGIAIISITIFVPNGDSVINTSFTVPKDSLYPSCPSPLSVGIDRALPANLGSFNIYFQNINGMRSKLTGFKLSVLENEYDIIAIVETWLYPDIFVGEFLSENDYNIFRRDR